MTKADYKQTILSVSDDKDEIIDRLIDEIFKLREEIDKLKNKPAQVVRYPMKKAKKRWKKLGRSAGHPGSTREKPENIDREEHQRLEICPDCGSGLLSELESEQEEHIQEDIIPVKVEAVKYIRHGYWCPNCKDKKMAPYAPEEIPYGYLGPNILIQAVLMKYRYHLSYEKMAGMFFSFSSLKITSSALAQALARIAKWLNVEEAVILEAWVFYRRFRRLKERLWEFTIRGFKDKNWNRIKKRLLKYHKEIFTFLEVKGIAPDNNHAERMIKPNVIMRKISFQNMSEKGARTHEVLMSLLQTLNLQNQDSKKFFTTAYLKHRQGNPEPILSL